MIKRGKVIGRDVKKGGVRRQCVYQNTSDNKRKLMTIISSDIAVA